MRMPSEKAYVEYGFRRDIPMYSDECLPFFDGCREEINGGG